MTQMKVLVAFSGGLDTSSIIPWLKETYNAEVYAYCCNLGGLPDGEVLKKRALELGAKEFIFEDLRQKFVEEYVFPMLRAGATYQSDYLLGTAIARPLQALRTIQVAKDIGADAVCHGATGKGNDHLRFEKIFAYFAPELKVIVPWKTWEFKGRSDLVAYLNSQGFSYDGVVNPKYSVDVNLFHRSCEGGILEDISQPYPEEEVLGWIQIGSMQKQGPEQLEISFSQGIPMALNGAVLSGHEILEKLNTIGGAFGIGIVDLVEERMNGIKSRGIYETPGGTLLQFALKNLKQIVWNRELHSLASMMSGKYGQYIYDGQWFSQERSALEALFSKAGSCLTGSVQMKLFPGGKINVEKRTSPYSLYSESLVSFEQDTQAMNKAAEGYTAFCTFPHKLAGKVGI